MSQRIPYPTVSTPAEEGGVSEAASREPPSLGPLLMLGQGLYYLVTGIWPLLSIGSFQKVTGPKTDLWLVKMVGVLAAVIGGVLTMGGLRRRAGLELPLLSIGSAAGFAAIDLVYALRGRISPVYLMDALAEAGILGGWVAVRITGGFRSGRRGNRE